MFSYSDNVMPKLDIQALTDDQHFPASHPFSVSSFSQSFLQFILFSQEDRREAAANYDFLTDNNTTTESKVVESNLS